MKSYLLHTLSHEAFEELVVKMCHEILGIGTIAFSSGKDGGRDAHFEGTAQNFPSSSASWSGRFVIQAKHTKKIDASCSDSDFSRILREEGPKVAALRQAGLCDNYLLFTNRKLTGLKEVDLTKGLRHDTGIDNIAILGKETIASWLDDHPRILEHFGIRTNPFMETRWQLEPPPVDFTGREIELQEIRDAVAESEGQTLIYALRGQAGIGKTTLALRAAEKLRDHYPDGQFKVELRGTNPEPMTVSEAMGRIINSLRPEVRLPHSEHQVADTYRTVLQGKRILLLLDNAASAEQVEPLLPLPRCLVLITTRFHFSIPGLRHKNLSQMTRADASRLLLEIAPRIRDQAESLAQVCGDLPLALRLAGSFLATRENKSVGDYLRELNTGRKRLDEVEASIALSYELLTPELKDRFADLSVLVGPFDDAAAAAVWNVEEDEANDSLGELLTTSLVDWNSARYNLHDLVREFGEKELGSAQTARRRHATYFERVLHRLEQKYLQGGEQLLAALADFAVQWPDIRAGQAWAASASRQDEHAASLAISYPLVGVHLLALRRTPKERMAWLQASAQIAMELGDLSAKGTALGNIGLAYESLGDYGRAISYAEKSLEISREFCDRKGEAGSLQHLGQAHCGLGNYSRAMDFYDMGLQISRDIGDRQGEGEALTNLGVLFAKSGRFDRAIDCFRERLKGSQKSGDRRTEAESLANLGQALVDCGRAEEAIGHFEESLRIIHEIGHRHGEAAVQGNLGLAYLRLGLSHRAIDSLEQCLVTSREFANLELEGSTLGNLGLAYAHLDHHQKAIDYYEESLRIARTIGSQRNEAMTSWNLGLAYEKAGLLEKAIEAMSICVEFERSVGHPDADADAAHVEALRQQLNDG